MSSSKKLLTKMYINEIVRLHGVPISIVSDRDPRFTSEYWKSVHRALQTKLNFSLAYHPQTDGQSERTIQALEDMLRCCVLEMKGSWEDYLPLAEFAYNNSYQASIQMAPYELLYGRKCRSPIHFQWRTDWHYHQPCLEYMMYFIYPNEIVELSPVELKPDLTYEERPERIVDYKEQLLRHRIIKYVKVQWKNHSEREATWETEDSMRERYPELFEI
ncbi:uncharacterized protein LOC109825361 [Asparagus officinalis]|uniref:uncharacterized protein LOC109825361 n=1 Tax=Asparagus officinalis TaxID=4686 RepID=UPI00098E787C|nr:uncharacterized protein LOC109825361 [Asparagus officinalis]